MAAGGVLACAAAAACCGAAAGAAPGGPRMTQWIAYSMLCVDMEHYAQEHHVR